jgi:hypothetical protein
MAVSQQRGFAAEQHRALPFLAGAPLGATEAMMLAHGFTNATLDALVRDGLATAERRAVKAGWRPIQSPMNLAAASALVSSVSL